MPTILTAGYGNRGFAPFIDLLKEHQVTHLVDVRSVPSSSYWTDFRRENLIDLVPPTGLRYVYMGDTLGGTPKPAEPGEKPPIFCKESPGSVNIHPLFHDPNFRMGLGKLVEAAGGPRKICLMCGCLRPHNCHRSKLIGPALVEIGVDVFHLNESGIPVAQAQVETEREPEQASLFAM